MRGIRTSEHLMHNRIPSGVHMRNLHEMDLIALFFEQGKQHVERSLTDCGIRVEVQSDIDEFVLVDLLPQRVSYLLNVGRFRHYSPLIVSSPRKTLMAPTINWTNITYRLRPVCNRFLTPTI